MRVGPDKETAVRTDIDYGPPDRGFPVPRSFVQTSVSPDSTSRVEWSYEVWRYDAEFPEADFRLSAFGPLGDGR